MLCPQDEKKKNVHALRYFYRTIKTVNGFDDVMAPRLSKNNNFSLVPVQF